MIKIFQGICSVGHNVMLAKLETYGIECPSFELITVCQTGTKN